MISSNKNSSISKFLFGNPDVFRKWVFSKRISEQLSLELSYMDIPLPLSLRLGG